MKIRSDYVSNSSSSSFIVINTKGKDETEHIKTHYGDNMSWEPLLFPNKDAKHSFGWEYVNTASFLGKLNFIGIQLLYLFVDEDNGHPNDKWEFIKCYDMLKKVMIENFNCRVKLDTENLIKTKIWENGDKYESFISIDDDFYIDHQSAVTDDMCMEMFESEEKLIDFIKYDSSYIEGGNDNYTNEEREDF